MILRYHARGFCFACAGWASQQQRFCGWLIAVRFDHSRIQRVGNDQIGKSLREMFEIK
jgi:hypothetical protein